MQDPEVDMRSDTVTAPTHQADSGPSSVALLVLADEFPMAWVLTRARVPCPDASGDGARRGW